MIDTHSHVLPFVDDGSQDIEESIEMIRQSAACGVKILVVTPHSNQKGRFENYYTNDLKMKFRRLREAVEEAGINIKLVMGMEIYSSPDLLELLENGMFCGLNCSDYFLVEFPFDARLGYMYSMIEQIFDAGGIPIIAHPERYYEIQKNPAVLYDWIQEGVCTQINKGSVLGSFGPNVQKAAEFMFAFDLVTCIGSDAHTPEVRNPDMSGLRTYLLDKYGPEYMKKVTRDNAFLILQNKDVPTHGIKPTPQELSGSGRRRRFF